MGNVKFTLLFLEGVLAFVSPCILPMLPIYFMYLTGKSDKKDKTFIVNLIGFILGFTIVFVTLGATATTLGKVLNENRLLLQRIGGIIIIIFGLNMMEIINIKFLNYEKKLNVQVETKGFFSSLLFGIVFSFGWSPCLGTFLGAALIMASSSSTLLIGMFSLFIFSLGLGLPFFIAGVLFNKLENSFDFIKKHYKVINTVSGILIIIVGLLMVTDLFGYYQSLFNF
ncbi:MAG: cytochrome c biogenesis protein CcdA [Clostridium sp.]|nr:cytochrome c biogenesis protein CcdA [Clostridium sp.]